MAQNPRPPHRPTSSGPVPPQVPGTDLPRSGAAQRPVGPRPSVGSRPGTGGPRTSGPGAGRFQASGSGRAGPGRPGGPTRAAVSSSAPSGPSAPGRSLVATTVAEPATTKKDLTVNKVLAGAGAAATSAVFGSYFGAAGTVAGAALGSVVTTLATTMYQRSLDRTREIALQKVKLPGRGDTKVLAEPVDPLATIPLQRGSARAPLLEPVLPAAPKRAWLTRKRVLVAVGSAVAAFLIGLLVITGVEWVKGSPISGGESGTSVSRVVTGGTAADTGTTETEESTPTTTEQAPDEESTGGGVGESTGGASPTTSPAPSSSAPPTTTSRAPTSAGQNSGGLGGTGLIGGGAESAG